MHPETSVVSEDMMTRNKSSISVSVYSYFRAQAHNRRNMYCDPSLSIR